MTTKTIKLPLMSSAVAALVVGPLFAQQPADTFYSGGDILTMKGGV